MNDPSIPPFNLLDAPWIPCLALAPDGAVHREELGLQTLLERAHEITELTSASPLVTIALYRMLLALMHRVYGPADEDAWWALWKGRKANAEKLHAYLDEWRPRFNLFDAERPFYQDAAISEEYAGSIAELTPEQASDSNKVLLFDHGQGAAVGGLTPAAAACYLTAFHSYAVGGFMSFEKGQDPKIYKSAKAGPLVKGAVLLVRGETLWQTLLLNMVRYPREQRTRHPGKHDMPAWERPKDKETTGLARLPDGYLDYLTWQSRRVRLFPDIEGEGEIVVRRVAALKGHPFAPGFERRHEETMMAFTQTERTKTEDGQDDDSPFTFRDERALWRDSTTVFITQPGKSWRPQTLQWLDDLKVRRQLGVTALPLDALGMRSDQATIHAWHHERLPLPLAYLEKNKALFEKLGLALTLVDGVKGVGLAVHDSTRELAKLLIAPDADDKSARQPLTADVNGLAKSLGVERIFWAALDEPFTRFLLALPEGLVDDDPDGERFDDHARTQLDIWADALYDASLMALRTMTDGLDSSARALKAAALGERARHSFVAKALEPYGRRTGATIALKTTTSAQMATTP